MMLIEDTRNQVGKHKQLNQDLQSLGVQVVRSKLYVGDYARIENQTVCIDTKKDYVELASNICGSQHKRFRDECLRAKTVGIRLVILVEEEIPAELWKSPLKRNLEPYTRVKGETLAKCMETMHQKYGVEFKWCAKKDTAKTIMEILSDD